MSDPDDDMNAALLASGALTAGEAEAMRDRMSNDPGFARIVEAWEQGLAPLAAGLAPVDPPLDLFAKIEARLDRGGQSRTLRAAAGTWTEIGPGIRIKDLHRDPVQGRQTFLLVADPGAEHPAHVHDADEEVFMVSGDLTIDGEDLGPGDFHFSPRGSTHPRETTRGGCTCVITMGI